MAPREKALPKRMFSDPESWAMAVVAAAARPPRRKLRLTIFRKFKCCLRRECNWKHDQREIWNGKESGIEEEVVGTIEAKK